MKSLFVLVVAAAFCAPVLGQSHARVSIGENWALGDSVRDTRKPGWVELMPPPIPGAVASASAWHAIKPYDLKIREYKTIDKDERVAVSYLSVPGEYAIVCTQGVWDGEKMNMSSTTYIITVEGDKPNPPGPGPDPDPVPPSPAPTGLAGECYRKAKSVNLLASHAKGYSEAFDGVVSAIGAGGIKTITDMDAGLYQRMPRLDERFREPYRPFTSWLSGYMRKHHPKGSDVKAAAETLEKLSQGIKATLK